MAKAETLGKKPFLGAGILAILMAGGFYLWEKRPQIPEENPNLPGAGLVLPEFTPTLVPTPTEVKPTPTFTPEPTPEGPKSLPPVISKESLAKAGIGLTPWTPEQISKAQQEAMAKEGILKVALPYDFLEIGGEIHQKMTTEVDLFFVLKNQTPFSFSSLTEGEVIDVVQSGTIPTQFNLISVRFSNNIKVNYITLRNSKFLITKGQSIKVGQSIISGEFDPNSEGQKMFERGGYFPQNTVVGVAYGEIGRDKAQDLSLLNILRGKRGEVVVISSLK